MMEQDIVIQKTVRYTTFGNIKNAENIWFILHGYGQLPRYFIRKFQELNPDKHFIVAPEGFHRFYLKGSSGRVGASWMTKEARLDDIKNNIDYLNQLATKILKQKDFKNRILLGFSQGGATAARWHQKGDFKAHHFILWASVFPPDLSFEGSKEGMFTSQNYFIVGNEDEYFKQEIENLKNFYQQQSFLTEFITFQGTHDIDTPTLQVLAQKIEK